MERSRDGFVINFGEQTVHANPPWGDCNMDQVGSEEKAVRSEDQLAEYKGLGFTLCKKCLPKQAWPRG